MYHANFNIEILCFLSVGYELSKNSGPYNFVNKLAPMVKSDEIGNKDVGWTKSTNYRTVNGFFFFSAVLMLVTKIRVNSSVS